jgi:SPP1 family predicted phage head-tail adaptor
MAYKWAESLNAGDLNQSVELETGGLNASGDEITSYTPLMTVRGSVEPLRGREYLDAEKVNSEVDTRIRIRYREGLDTAKRATVRGTVYDIRSIINPHGSNRVLELMCKTVS